MAETTTFKICADYKRDDLDFAKIQYSKDNPLNKKGLPTYPDLISSNQGSSFTYQISKDWFFKRKLQDGGSPLNILSQHHFNQAYNELCGSFDDLGEVIAYFLAKNIIDPKTGEPIVFIPEYRLATFTDKENIMYRGCLSKNICENSNEQLITIADMMKFFNITGNSIETYMQALKKFASIKKYNCEFEQVRRTLILYSYACWKIANSDNHKHNIVLILKKAQDGSIQIIPKGMIDNGSSYELSSPYIIGGKSSGEFRFAKLLTNDAFSSLDKDGNRVFDFAYYPYMHTAFYLDADSLVDKNTKINGINFAYEYSLASEMLSDKELYRLVYEFEKQLNIETAIDSINEIYGASVKGAQKTINWPPYLKEFMFETNNIKSKTLSYVIADYYLSTVYNNLIEKSDKDNPTKLYSTFRDYMLTIPIQSSKEDYDKIFIDFAKKLNIEIDNNKLKNINFKLNKEMEKSENQPV